MKKREFEQLKIKPAEERRQKLSELKDKLWSLRADLVAGKVKNVREIRAIRKDIARILTLLKSQ